jgi:hypothetical protein
MHEVESTVVQIIVLAALCTVAIDVLCGSLRETAGWEAVDGYH